MKKIVTEVLSCLECGADYALQQGALACARCGATIPLHDGIPLFTSPPPGLQPSEKLVRGPQVGTPWRRANWRFLNQVTAALPADAIILDVGAGRGDFAELFENHHYLALDIYPYPEVDLACDLAQVNPFKPGSFDAILLMNVLEHVYEPVVLLQQLAQLLKPGGLLVVAVPFMVKMHQLPVDFNRYTQFSLQRMADDLGMAVEHLDGFYDPVSLLGEGLGNLRFNVLPRLAGWRRYAGRLVLAGLQALTSLLRRVLGPGKILAASTAKNPAPTGYHIIYRKRTAE